MTETIQHADGRVELKSEALAEISNSPLYNEDLAPVPVERRNWTTYNYAALWISMAHCIPTYMMASGLISAGMNWWQALITILARKYYRACADSFEFASRNEIRHSVSGFCTRRLWHIRLESSGIDACDCRVRLVRDSGVDRRAGDSYFFLVGDSELANAFWR